MSEAPLKDIDKELLDAAERLEWERFEGLALRGAALSPKNGGPSPLSVAALAMTEESDTRALTELLRLGARLEGSDRPSLSASVVAARAPMSAIKALAQGGAWKDPGPAGWPSVLIRLAHGDWITDEQAAERVLEIARAGAEMEALDDAGRTALRAACQRGRVECAKALLAAGALPDAKDANGSTALMWVAIVAPDTATALAQALMEAGANPNEPDLNGLSPVDIARMKSLGEMDKGLFGALRAGEERRELSQSAGPAVAGAKKRSGV